jgi:hypothetical protein
MVTDCRTTIFLDTNCVKHFRSASVRDAYRRQTRVIAARTVPTCVNLVEVLRDPESGMRTELVQAIRHLADGRALMPWPYGLIEDVGRSLYEQRPRFPLKPSGLESLLDNPNEKARATAEKLAVEMEEDFREMHRRGRPILRRFLKSLDMSDPWASSREFLDELWMRRSHIEDYIIGLWRRLELPGDAPVDELIQNPTWRAYHEAHGVAAYEQALAPNQPRPFGIMDLLQLVYPTGFDQSIYVTGEQALHRAAKVVLDPVPGVRVELWTSFFEPEHPGSV